MPKYKVTKTFRDSNGKWYQQGQIVEFIIEIAKVLIMNNVIVPIIDAINKNKPIVENAEKKIENLEKAVSSTQIKRREI